MLFIMVNILCYEIPRSCIVLYFANITRNTVIKADRYLFQILIAASKKAITKRLYKAEPLIADGWLKIEKIEHQWTFQHDNDSKDAAKVVNN